MKKTTKFILILCLIFLASQKILAGTNYVSLTGGHISPFDTWEKAATNIQNATDAASYGNTVLITNGIYYPANKINMYNSIIIKSVNGAEDTIVDGDNKICPFSFNGGDIIDGLTIQNGYSTGDGGGINCSWGIGLILNCIIRGNSADGKGGGVCYGIINNSTIIGNSSGGNGGGAYYGSIYNCSIIVNSSGSNGGGLYEGTVNSCTIVGNSAKFNGGGNYNGTLTNSIVYYNSAQNNSNRNGGIYNYCCTTSDATNGIGNISTKPMLLSISHIATNSPCIGAGSTNYVSGTDIDGEAWKNPPSIGCDEVYANAISGSLSVAISANKDFTYINKPLSLFANIKGKISKNIWTFDDKTSETNKVQIARVWNTVGKYNVVLTAFNETYPAGLSNYISINVVSNINFVNINNLTPIPPYLTWETAATNIQDAVDIAVPGNIVLVTNGIYCPGSQISVTNDITIKSVNGHEVTIVDGNGTNRCFNLNNGAVLDGFTISNGFSFPDKGGGIFCRNGTVQNCNITANSGSFGGGIYSYKGRIKNCVISKNTASATGGAYFHLSVVENCTITENSASYLQSCSFCTDGGTLMNCILWNNINFRIKRPISINFNNCIEGWTNLVNGIITNDPEFVNAGAGDYRLKSFSPCINSGTNLNWMWASTDFDGEDRILGDYVDMGAYEQIPEPFSILLEFTALACFIFRTKTLIISPQRHRVNRECI